MTNHYKALGWFLVGVSTMSSASAAIVTPPVHSGHIYGTRLHVNPSNGLDQERLYNDLGEATRIELGDTVHPEVILHFSGNRKFTIQLRSQLDARNLIEGIRTKKIALALPDRIVTPTMDPVGHISSIDRIEVKEATSPKGERWAKATSYLTKLTQAKIQNVERTPEKSMIETIKGLFGKTSVGPTRDLAAQSDDRLKIEPVTAADAPFTTPLVRESPATMTASTAS